MILLGLTATAALAFVSADALHRGAAPAAVHHAAPHGSPLAGTWTLDVAGVPAEERPRSVTIRFTPEPGHKWKTLVEIVSSDGTSRRGESIAATDGVPVRATGTLDFMDSVSLRQPAANTLVMTLSKNNTPVSTRVYAVARDGRTMSETIVWPGSTVPRLETNHFIRGR